jgi:transposase-like protein
VSYHLSKHGLKPVGEKYTSRGIVAKPVLRELVDAQLSLEAMARELEVSVSTVRRWLKRYGFPTPAGDKRAEARRARQLGLLQTELECPHHGRTLFVLERRGSYRCQSCRQERVAEWRRRAKRRLVERAGGACVLCGYDRWPGALEFHHLDPTKKAFGLSTRGLTRSFERLTAEADKCVLLCANCHAEVEGGFATLERQSSLAA